MIKTLMAAEEETLYEHIDEALRQYNERFLSKGYGIFINNRFKRLSLSFKNCETMVALAILLHDSGKAHFKYQENIGKQRIGIIHEVYSATLAWKTLQISESEKDVIAAAILLHHEYMRLPSLSDKGFEGYIEELRTTIEELASKYGLLHLLDVSKMTTLSSKDVNDVVDRLCSRLRDEKFYVCTVLILRPLVICDNLSAAHHRKGRPQRLFEDIEDPSALSMIRDCLLKEVQRA